MKKPHTIGYCLFHGTKSRKEDKNSVYIRPTHEIRALTETDIEAREPLNVSGITFSTPDHVRGLETFNEKLAKEDFLCYPIEESSYQVQLEYGLDDFFTLYELTDIRGKYSLALNLNAMYMHCHALERELSQRNTRPSPLSR